LSIASFVAALLGSVVWQACVLAQRRRGRGIMRKGIAALLGLRGDGSDQGSDQIPGVRIEELPVDAIRTSPFQARTTFDDDDTEALARSIREHGVLQPILVRRINASIELVAGERRLRAAKRAGLTKIPAVVVELRDQEAAIVSLSENIQRRDLDYLEQARGYRKIIDRFGCSQAELARMLGVSEDHIGSRLRLLSLGDELLSRVDTREVLEGHLHAVLRLPDAKTRQMVLDDVCKRKLSVKQTNILVDKLLDLKKRQSVVKILADARLLLNSIKKAVKDMEQSGIGVEYSQDVTEDWIDVRIRIANKGI
jgi:ParB family chromosome partitioning protein